MRKITENRDAQLIFQSFYVAFAVIACIGSVGFYDMKFTGDFYIYFTNITTYLCAGVMVAELIQTIRKREDSYVTTAPGLRFISMLGLILTFIIFNAMLAHDPARDPALNYKVECILCHIILPIMYISDWVMFYEHGKIKWKLPILSALFPLMYLVYVFVHAALRHFDSSIMNYAGTDPVIYPYFFLNPERVGIGGMAVWILVLLVAFVLLGYLFMLIDHFLVRRRDRKSGGNLEEKYFYPSFVFSRINKCKKDKQNKRDIKKENRRICNMKKAFGMAMVNSVCFIALFTILDFVFIELTGGNWIADLMRPDQLRLLGTLAVLSIVIDFFYNLYVNRNNRELQPA